MRFGINAKGMLKVQLQMLFPNEHTFRNHSPFRKQASNKDGCLELQPVTGFACRLTMQVPMKAVGFAIAVAALGFGRIDRAYSWARSPSPALGHAGTWGVVRENVAANGPGAEGQR